MTRFDQRALWLSRQVLPHEPALRHWLARRPAAGLDIDDIVQETYARLSSIDDVSTIGNVKNYMFRTAYSLILSHLRRAQIVSISSYANMEEFNFIDDQADPEETAIARDELMRLGEIIAKMPPRVREVLLLRRVEGLPQRQVAERLGVSESTIEKQLADGMMRLSDAYSRGGKRGPQASKHSEMVERSNDATRNKPTD
jgi:RNA polymerase sigma-70 factor (ECF subfamily)